MNLILFIQLITFLLVFALGCLVLYKNPRRDSNFYFLIFAAGTAGWNLSLFMVIGEYGQPLLWGRLAFAFGSFMPAGLYLFSVVFPWTDKRARFEKVLLSAMGLIFFVIPLTNLMIKSAFSVNRTYIAGELVPRIYFPYLLYYFGFLIFAFIKLILKHRKGTPIQKTQLKYVIIGVISFFIPVFTTQLILPLFFGRFQYNNLGPLFSLPMIALIGYAIVKHQLMDIRIFIQRGLVYTFLFACTVSFYLFTLSILGYFFQQTTDLAVVVSAGITTLVGIYSIPLIEKYFRKVTDKIFFKDKYDYATALHELSEITNKTLDLEELLTQTSRKLKQILKSEAVEFLLDSGVGPAKIQEPEVPAEDLKIPIVSENEQLAILKLKKKLSGDLYNSEDLRLLKTFVYQAAVAIKKAELYEKVKEYSLGLEQKVEQRTVQIQKLQEEQKQMMVDIAHGLQTPLTVIKMELGTLKKQAPPQQHLETFEKSLDGVSRFIYDLLNLAKLETQKENFKKDSVDVSVLLRELVEYFEVLALDLKITISAAIEPNVVLWGDKDTLNELVTNLVSNAFKYMDPSREKRVNITLVRRNGGAELIVEDTGMGIGNEDLPKIFNRFYRVSHPDTTLPKGTGLGLAICKKIVERHNGTIEVESELGRGTKFIIRF